jgi:stage V sporulation protein G
VEITEVRIKLMDEGGDRLQAFCSITFDDCFVIRDLKIIEGTNGPFVAMPSRKLTSRCPQCGSKNHLRAAHCNQCALRLKEERALRDDNGRAKLYADIAHPINSACREMIQSRIIAAFREEQERAKLPGYVSNYDDFDHEDYVAEAYDPSQLQRPAAKLTSQTVGEREPLKGPHHGPGRKPGPPKQTPHQQRAPQSQTQQDPPQSFGAGIL